MQAFFKSKATPCNRQRKKDGQEKDEIINEKSAIANNSPQDLIIFYRLVRVNFMSLHAASDKAVGSVNGGTGKCVCMCARERLGKIGPFRWNVSVKITHRTCNSIDIHK